MQSGDLVFIMGDPSRPILGTRTVGGLNCTETITHGTPALVVDVDNDCAAKRVHVEVLVQGMTLWVPGGFVKASNEEGDLAVVIDEA
jgi:hypothetical protein